MNKFTAVAGFIAVGLIAAWLIIFNVCYPLRYRSEIADAAQTYNIDPALIASIINAESSFDKDKVSPKQAIGLMQLLPSTAAALTNQEEIDLFDPGTNIILGVKYLSYLIKKFK